MAFYVDEEEVWKCPKHPSKRRRSGICPTCLRERLSILCSDCGHVRPCSCCPTTTTTTGNSSSIGKVSNLIDIEPSFRRSRSVALPFLRSRSRFSGDSSSVGSKTTPFWSVFKKTNRKDEEEKGCSVDVKEEEQRRNMMMRSKSVGFGLFGSHGGARSSSSSSSSGSSKGKSWYFPSPMKVFRHSKTSKVVQERSPLYRG
ncbi:hypothetical protein RJ641_000891 [Dillenia turbinata]|uniref:Uncharacterized protein n=1 Tax=Dillenia turbinata TaxID=194707 RepID=A0AAN8ZUL5_9MAGN